MSFWVRDKGFYKNLFLLAVPIILQNFITYGVTLADNIMVGQLDETAILGLFFGSRIQLVLQILLFGLESSIVILSSQYWGKRDCDHIKDVVSVALRCAFVFAALLAINVACCPEQFMRIMTSKEDVILSGASYLRWVSLSYVFFAVNMMLLAAMRSVEIARIGLINSIVALIVNCGANYVLIYGYCGFPMLGVKGAAIATVLSRFVEFAVVLFFVLKLDRNLRLRFRDLKRWNKGIVSDLIKYGAPLMAGQLVWALNQFVRPVIVGSMPKEAGAAVSICDTYDSFLCIGAFSMAAATGVIIGKTIGQGNVELVKLQAKTMQVIFLAYGILVSFVAFLCRDVFLSCYSLSEETLNVARQLMYIVFVVVAGRSFQAPSLLGLVKAGGDTSFVFKLDVFFVFFVVLPAAIIAQYYYHAPVWVVYICLLCDQVLKCFVAVVKINSFNWMKKVTRTAETPN